jgi:hypothetical protein
MLADVGEYVSQAGLQINAVEFGAGRTCPDQSFRADAGVTSPGP